MNVDDAFWKTILDNLYDGVCFIDRDTKVTYWNKGAERITGYKSCEALGTYYGEGAPALAEESSDAAREDLFAAGDRFVGNGLYQESEVFLHHKEGHRIPVLARIAPIRGMEAKVVGGVVLFSDNRAAVEARLRIEQLEQTALLDAVTGLGNRRFSETQIRRSLDEQRRYGWRFGCMLIAVDKYQSILDEFGPDTADQAAKTVANTISGNIRRSDILGRWQDDTLVAVMLNMGPEHLDAVATKLKVLVEKSTLKCPATSMRLTVSIAAAMGLENDDVESLTARLEELLETSKTGGGNRVTLQQG